MLFAKQQKIEQRHFKKHFKIKISHVHISDSGEMGDCLLIGRGRFNFRQFFGKLAELNPDCSVVLELYRSGFNGISDLVSSYNAIQKMTEPYNREKQI